MNAAEVTLLVIVIFALVALGAFQVFRQRAKVRIKGPGKTGLDLDASNEQKAAINVEDAKSRAGGFTGVDRTGRGIDAKRLDVEKDINIAVDTQNPKG